MIEFAVALLLWLSVFALSSAVASIAAQKSPERAGLLMQIMMLLLSLGAMEAMGGVKSFNLFRGWKYIPQAFLLGFLFSLILSPLQKDANVPGFLPEGPERAIILLLIAPLSEETFNRGLVEGYLLGYSHSWSAIVFSALLFALPHWMAFKGTREERAFIVLGAFVLGILAGHFFSIGGLVPAFALHSSANSASIVVLKFRERPGYK